MSSTADETRNWLLGVIAVILSVAAVRVMRTIVVPVLFAAAVAILLWPLVERLSRRRPFWSSVLAAILAFSLGVALVGVLLTGSVQNMVSAMPKYGAKLDATVSRWARYAREHGFDVREIRSVDITRKALTFVGQGFSSARSVRCGEMGRWVPLRRSPCRCGAMSGRRVGLAWSQA